MQPATVNTRYGLTITPLLSKQSTAQKGDGQPLQLTDPLFQPAYKPSKPNTTNTGQMPRLDEVQHERDPATANNLGPLDSRAMQLSTHAA
jgi:hypothetical protein